MFSTKYNRYYVCYPEKTNGVQRVVCPNISKQVGIDTSNVKRQVSSRMRFSQRLQRNLQLR